MTQMLLWPDPRPLVERLGPEFFRQAPARPGVYLMRDGAGIVLYVGKAKDLRKRLTSYRVANPERLKRRQLRLLRAVERIDLQECPNESAALARESELLRNLRPRFNRAGVWPGSPRFLVWRVAGAGVEIAIAAGALPGWVSRGPLGAGAAPLRAALIRLLWCAFHPQCGIAGMPEGWFSGRLAPVASVAQSVSDHAPFEAATAALTDLFVGNPLPFIQWVTERTAADSHPFERAVREADLETVTKLLSRPDQE